MRQQITTARPVIYVEDAQTYPIQRYDTYEVVTVVRRRSRRPLSDRIATITVAALVLGTVGFVGMCFIVTDIGWFVGRAMAAGFILLMVGGFASLAVALYEDVKEFFLTLMGR